MNAYSLRQSIKGTNNGYLFAPSGEEIALAQAHPELFRVNQNMDPQAVFPWRIWNRDDLSGYVRDLFIAAEKTPAQAAECLETIADRWGMSMARINEDCRKFFGTELGH